jgi:hypothetical protein
MFTAGFGLGLGNYQVKCHFNPWLKAGYIVWLGTREALIEDWEKEFAKQKTQDPGLERKTVTTTVVLKVPSPPERAKKAEGGEVADKSESEETCSLLVGVPVDLTDVHLGNAQEIFPPKNENYIVSVLDPKTKPAYENVLNRAISIFDAQPGTPEFDELALLLPLISHYEASNIELPPLAIWDAVKLKMEQIDMPSSFLVRAIGSQDETDQFLAGQISLSEQTLQEVCDLLFLRVPLNDQSLIK